ncbi:MAG TPA: FeoB-associated Cys-rich membrane protein [Gemmataceae bacterium]|nr:FeoB-associated Cys-rich membrane protein [Gemmataceae bacterium]
MDWQQLLVGLIVTAAACYLGRQAWHAWRDRGAGCGGGCGKTCTSDAANGQAALIPPEQLTLRHHSPKRG